ncbi:protein of unknown function (plasmid) [Caballeronia sp. S22]
MVIKNEVELAVYFDFRATIAGPNSGSLSCWSTPRRARRQRSLAARGVGKPHDAGPAESRGVKKYFHEKLSVIER